MITSRRRIGPTCDSRDSDHRESINRSVEKSAVKGRKSAALGSLLYDPPRVRLLRRGARARAFEEAHRELPNHAHLSTLSRAHRLHRSNRQATAAGFGFLADQLRRSACSVTSNYVEGCGRVSQADRKRFFVIAIGSAMESAGHLDVMKRFGLLGDQDLTLGQDLCDHLVAMLRRFR